MDARIQIYQAAQHPNVLVVIGRPPKDGKSKIYNGRRQGRQMTHGDGDGKI